ncbi:hypothetical protein ACWGDX_08990 [Streptomyces sp. NPDC055025]
MTGYAVSGKPEIVEEYTHLDVERPLLCLPTRPEAETLAHLDRLADAAGRFR